MTLYVGPHEWHIKEKFPDLGVLALITGKLDCIQADGDELEWVYANTKVTRRHDHVVQFETHWEMSQILLALRLESEG